MPFLKHYGMPRRSGRYPWGSGNEPYQSDMTYVQYVNELRKIGKSKVEIAKEENIKTPELKARMALARTIDRRDDVSMALRLKDKGYSTSAIGRRMGINESSVRSLLDPVLQDRAERYFQTANVLKKSLEEKGGYIDVGLGMENQLNVSRTAIMNSLELLKLEGYKVYHVKQEQAGTGKNTMILTLAKPDTPYKEVLDNKDKIRMITEYRMSDDGRSALGLTPPLSVNSKDIYINYESPKDGVIELKRGVKELDLGNSHYAQVRIAVDDTHFLKGMAMYSDSVPDGYKIAYNTNKKPDTPAKATEPGGDEVFKPMKKDINGNILLENPFGAAIKAGGQKGSLNIVNEEGDWEKWSKNISSQILSKQPIPLIKQQLDLAFKLKEEEYETIMSVNNPSVKKKLLETFANDCDGATVHLKAAALPRQAHHIILPFPNIKENQVYAPNYIEGEEVVLIRHPHGGIFEIPTLIVNNSIKSVKNILGNSRDAIGINPKVAERLSGADFDGDTVLVIPTKNQKIATAPALKQLKDFNPRELYKLPPTAPKLDTSVKEQLMGSVSNLITDMTIKGAVPEEIARAVKHSMVVIDAEKHHLDYKKSYVDNGISSLKKKYQGGVNAGASTIISKAKSPVYIDQIKDFVKVDPQTGKKLYTFTNESYVDSKGKVIKRKTKISKMLNVEDANELSSGSVRESYYVDYANKLKKLANESRKESYNTQPKNYSPSAAKAYAKEVKELKAGLLIALKNAPLERQAQLLAGKWVTEKKKTLDNPDYKTMQKIKGQAIVEARLRVGAKKERIDVTPLQWEAIQAGAVSTNTLKKILDNTNLEVIKMYATPRNKTALTPAKLAKAKSMERSGYTRSEIADAIGVSTSTLSKELK